MYKNKIRKTRLLVDRKDNVAFRDAQPTEKRFSLLTKTSVGSGIRFRIMVRSRDMLKIFISFPIYPTIQYVMDLFSIFLETP